MSKVGQAAPSTLAFQSGYSLSPTSTAPILIVGSTAFIAAAYCRTAMP